MIDLSCFKERPIGALSFNPFTKIGSEWMLLTAGDESKYNTMTASWGGVGVMWNKNVVFAFIRPQRYTFEFFEQNDLFTVSFFDSEYKSALAFCGSHSGRDCDKAAETGLTPCFTEGTAAFKQAKLVLVCRKLSGQFIDPEGFADGGIRDNYADGDYHKMYVGEIVKILERE